MAFAARKQFSSDRCRRKDVASASGAMIGSAIASQSYRYCGGPGYFGGDGYRHPCPSRHRGARVRGARAYSGAPPSSYERSATATPPSVNASAAISRKPNGSFSIALAPSTPTTGTSKVPIDAVAAGNRSSAANQQT